MVPQKCCAFIQYTNREAAEKAASRTFEQLILNVLYYIICYNKIKFLGTTNTYTLGSTPCTN